MTTGYEFITFYYSGANAVGGTPTDIITLGIRQFGVFGPMIITSIMSMVFKKIDKHLDNIWNNKFYFIQYRIILIGFIIVPYADFDSFLRNRYDLVLLLIFVIMLSHTKNKTENNDFKKGMLNNGYNFRGNYM